MDLNLQNTFMRFDYLIEIKRQELKVEKVI